MGLACLGRHVSLYKGWGMGDFLSHVHSRFQGVYLARNDRFILLILSSIAMGASLLAGIQLISVFAGN